MINDIYILRKFNWLIDLWITPDRNIVFANIVSIAYVQQFKKHNDVARKHANAWYEKND